MKHIDNKGISTIEAMVAVVLFGIVAAAVTASSVNSAYRNGQSKVFTAASALVQEKIEQLRALDATKNPADLTAGTHTDAKNPLDATGETGGNFTRTWTVTLNTPASGLEEIVVLVTWPGASGAIRGVTLLCSTNTCS
ncbi:MAG: type II secretion system protein [Deltaproteobacteria bacterium]|nr:type II secretion system protein [Deltaproteobacteria bacterium]